MKRSDDNATAPYLQVHSNPATEIRHKIEKDIRRLRFFSNRGLWALSLFLFICMLAWRDFPMLPLPDAVIVALGPAPPSRFISLMLVFYTFSAIILSLSRMTNGVKHKSSFCHVGYLTMFFLFYHFAKSLDENFWAVLGAGITILGVESYRIWSFCSENISLKNEQLDYLAKTGRLPTEE